MRANDQAMRAEIWKAGLPLEALRSLAMQGSIMACKIAQLGQYDMARASFEMRSIDVTKSYNEIDIAGKMPPGQYARIARILHEALREADPEAAMVGASLVYLGSDWCKELFHETDFADWHDVYDVHAHPMNPPKIGGSIGNGPSEGLTGLAVRIAEGAPKKPVWYGEVSPPLSHAEGGQWEQAANVVKQAAFAVAEPNVQVLAWLVPYGGAVPEIATSGPHHLP